MFKPGDKVRVIQPAGDRWDVTKDPRAWDGADPLEVGSEHVVAAFAEWSLDPAECAVALEGSGYLYAAGWFERVEAGA